MACIIFVEVTAFGSYHALNELVIIKSMLGKYTSWFLQALQFSITPTALPTWHLFSCPVITKSLHSYEATTHIATTYSEICTVKCREQGRGEG